MAIVKPVLPILQDFLAHNFWLKEHIATIHHEHGKEHWHLELQKASAETGTEPSTSVKYQDPIPVHLSVMNGFNFQCKCILEYNSPQEFSRVDLPYIGILVPPPRG